MLQPLNSQQALSHSVVASALQQWTTNCGNRRRYSFTVVKSQELKTISESIPVVEIEPSIQKTKQYDKVVLKIYSLPNGERLDKQQQYVILKGSLRTHGKECLDAALSYGSVKQSTTEQQCHNIGCSGSGKYDVTGKVFCDKCVCTEVWEKTLEYESQRCTFLLHHYIKVEMTNDNIVSKAGTTLQLEEMVQPITNLFQPLPWMSTVGQNRGVLEKIEVVVEKIVALQAVRAAAEMTCADKSMAFPLTPYSPITYEPETDSLQRLQTYRQHKDRTDLLHHLQDGVYKVDENYCLKIGNQLERTKYSTFASATTMFNQRVEREFVELASGQEFQLIPYVVGAAKHFPTCRSCGRADLNCGTSTIKCKTCSNVYCNRVERDTWCVPVTKDIARAQSKHFTADLSFTCVECLSRSPSPVSVMEDIVHLGPNTPFRIDLQNKRFNKNKIRLPKRSDIIHFDESGVVRTTKKRKRVQQIVNKMFKNPDLVGRAEVGGQWKRVKFVTSK
jgi:hypothetical protein